MTGLFRCDCFDSGETIGVVAPLNTPRSLSGRDAFGHKITDTLDSSRAHRQDTAKAIHAGVRPARQLNRGSFNEGELYVSN